jgi:hypothetical protein
MLFIRSMVIHHLWKPNTMPWQVCSIEQVTLNNKDLILFLFVILPRKALQYGLLPGSQLDLQVFCNGWL